MAKESVEVLLRSLKFANWLLIALVITTSCTHQVHPPYRGSKASKEKPKIDIQGKKPKYK